MRKKSFPDPKFLAVDFFCGAGGTTRGLIDAGGLVLAGLDNDKKYEKTYVSNNKNRRGDGKRPQSLPYDLSPKTRSHPAGEQHLALRDLAKILPEAKRSFPGTPLLFSMCAPCQPFTKLSKQKITDRRYRKHVRDRSLLLQCLVFVKRFRPDLVFCENVAGITSSQYGDVWRQFSKQLEKIGYATGSDVINAMNFGVPQSRKRSIMLAIKLRPRRKKYSSSSTANKIIVPSKDPSATLRTVRETIGHLPAIRAGEMHAKIPNHATQTLRSLNIQRLKCAVPGESNAYLGHTKFGNLSLKCHRKANRRIGQRCFNDVYTRMHPDQPAPTITTRCLSVSNGRFGHYDVKQIRGISLREAAFLQSFPSRYVFYPADKLVVPARMIGNAVPPRLARFFVRYLLSLIASKNRSRPFIANRRKCL